MVKVHAVTLGSEIRIGNYGAARLFERVVEPAEIDDDGNVTKPAVLEVVDSPCEVPDDVAAELAREVAGMPRHGKATRPGRKDIRVDMPPAAPAAALPKPPTKPAPSADEKGKG